MDAASFLSSIVEVAIGIAGFAGIVAAIRQGRVTNWPPAHRIMLQILFFASAATIFFALLPAVLTEIGLSAPLVWKISGGLLICWYVSAITFRTRQSRALGVTMPIPFAVLSLAVIGSLLQIYNILAGGLAWPFLIGVSFLIVNGFSMFLLLLLSPISEEQT